MTIRPTGIVFDAQDVPALAEFWRQATGYELTSKDDWFAELVPDGAGLKHIFIFRIKSGKTSKNRCHVDFETDDRGDEVARLVSLGAKRVVDHTAGDFNWTVLQDPEGNEFCISSPSGE